MNKPNAVRLGWLSLFVLLLPAAALAHERVKPGFNVFSVEQDVEIGRQSAAEAERQLPLLGDRSVDRYVGEIVRDLAASAPGAKYPYQVKVVNASDINAFALPGGFLYVNRGLIEVVRTEGELAGVLAHEMAHIALRHGTHQASRAYVAKAGLGILGGLLGRGGGSTSQILNAIGGLGLNALFLKFSRTAELEADSVGAQIMAGAGYDATEMATFFELLQQQRRRNPGRVEQFFSSHPDPANRAAHIRQEAQPVRGRRDSGELSEVQGELRRMSAAPSMRQIAQGESPRQAPRRAGGRPVSVSIEPPSGRFRRFEQRNRFFEIDYPENWRPYEDGRGYGVTIVPEGGVVDVGDGQSIVYGVIVNHYDPFGGEDRRGASRRRAGTLEGATDDIVAQVTRTNPHLRIVRGSGRRQRIDGAPALSSILAGRSPVTGQEERVTVFTRELTDEHVIYSLFIAPGQDYDELGGTFSRMVNSLRVNDRAAHP